VVMWYQRTSTHDKSGPRSVVVVLRREMLLARRPVVTLSSSAGEKIPEATIECLAYRGVEISLLSEHLDRGYR
jgi:hypothetical protein